MVHGSEMLAALAAAARSRLLLPSLQSLSKAFKGDPWGEVGARDINQGFRPSGWGE